MGVIFCIPEIQNWQRGHSFFLSNDNSFGVGHGWSNRKEACMSTPERGDGGGCGKKQQSGKEVVPCNYW